MEDFTTYVPVAAIIISGFSLGLSCLSLGWNIYRDVILKPKLRVKFTVSTLLWGDQQSKPLLILSAVNHGPGQITCQMPTVKNLLWKRLFRKATKFGVIIADHAHPLCFKLPYKLSMAEEINIIFPYDKECFLKEKFKRIGISDSFGRIHWAPRFYLKEAMKEYKKDFQSEQKQHP